MVPPNRATIIHRVERCHLIHTHRRHFQDPSDLIHHADTCKAMLSLSQVQKGHDSSLFVLAGIACEDLINEFLVLSGKFEGDGWIVSSRVSMLDSPQFFLSI